MSELTANVEAVLSIIEFKHTLHLYSSDVNKYTIQTPFIAAAKEGERVVYVTTESPAAVMKEFEGLGVEISVIKPEGLGGLTPTERGLRMVVDAGSIDPSVLQKLRGRLHEAVAKYVDHLKREKHMAESCKDYLILCTYDMGELTPDLVKQLVASHDKLVLTTSDATILAAESLDKVGITGESVQRFVKDDPEPIVLALTLKEPMCGTDIIKTIHGKFGVLLSPGTIYPLLHDLEKKGLLKCEYGIKTKTYKPVDGAEGKIRAMLEEHVKASRFLSRFLQVTGAAEKR